MTRAGIYLIALAGICVALWYVYFTIDRRGFDRCQKEMQQASLDLAVAYANRIVKAEGERDANQAIIDLAAAKSRSVPTHIPTCTDSSAENQDGKAGILSRRVDESFARLQERGTRLFERCEALNSDAIKVNAVTQ